MAKRKAAKVGSGTKVRVKEGVEMPEFSGLSIAGWEGTVLETQGKGPDQNIILEWSQTSLDQMPQAYKDHCESQGLFFGMACLPLSTLETDGGDG